MNGFSGFLLVLYLALIAVASPGPKPSPPPAYTRNIVSPSMQPCSQDRQLLQQFLDYLKAQKQAIITELGRLEADAAGIEANQAMTMSPQGATRLADDKQEIQLLQAQLAQIDVEIQQVVRRLQGP